MELIANCTRTDGCWIVEVPAIPGLFTQVRRLDQVEAMVLDAASLLLEKPQTAFSVTVIPQLPGVEGRKVESAKKVRATLARVEKEAASQTRSVVKDLRQQGLTVRDIATLLEITPARVSQLAA